jgi:hypothetical protein
MEKIMIAAVIAVMGFWVSGKPWVTPNEIGPIKEPPKIDKPAYNWVPQEPSKDLTKAEPNTFQL